MLSELSLPVSLWSRAGEVRLRRAVADDLRGLMALLSDDPISAARGDRADDADERAYAGALRRV